MISASGLNRSEDVEYVNCPLCEANRHTRWAEENGFTAVKCSSCGLIYVNPRPVSARIDEAVRTGAHSDELRNLNVVSRRIDAKVKRYRRVVAAMFKDVIETKRPLRWLDVGAGFGEVVEAVALTAPSGSRVEGLEPMRPKAFAAKARGLMVREGYLGDVSEQYDFVSAINVFSHIPDFRSFLADVKKVLLPGGEVLIETGNASDIGDRKHFPDELVLPDHLVFAGESQMQRFLADAGFRVIDTRPYRIDGIAHFARTAVKRILGRPVVVRIPYTSRARTVLFRAQMIREQ